VVARREATVSSKVAGQVADVMVEEGQHVQAGQIIARLDPSNARASMAQSSAQVAQAQANVRLAQAALNNASIKYGRYQGLAGEGVVAAQAIDDAKTQVDSAREQLAVNRQAVQVAQAGLGVAQRNLDDTVVHAPFTGVVTAKSAQPGEIVAPVAGGGFTRTGICTIVDMDSLEVDVDVAESFINRVAQGMPTSIRLDAYPDWDIPGSVIAVIPTADRSKATVTVRVGMNLKDARIVPDMGARVSFLAPSTPGAAPTRRGVVVPTDAVQTGSSDNTGVVYVIEDGRVERRAVRLGARESGGQVLLSGVSAGDQVAVGDFSQLHDGAKVRVTGQDQPSS
jgi:RND family efflux transporter MFP subunit